jgi:outer membrane lipoprotein SlyB
MSASSNPVDSSAPGAVQAAGPKPIVWWAAGGLGLLGAGALAAVLVAGPKDDAPAPAEPAIAKSTVASDKPTDKPSANSKPASSKPTKVAAASVCATCGTVESVKSETQKGEGTGLGAVGGAVLGGVVGHQMGGGDGKKALTVLGAVGGGFAGHEVEKRARSSTVYQVHMRMDDGSRRTVTQSTAPAVGARFQIEGNQLKPLAAAKG